jgi:hypothetical protein
MIQRLIMLLVAAWLAGCIGTSQSNVAPTLVAPPSLVPATPTVLISEAKTRQISNNAINDYSWTPDGQALIYSQSEKCPTGCKTTWYRFDVATGVTTTFKPEIVTIDPQVWKRLSGLDIYTRDFSATKSKYFT